MARCRPLPHRRACFPSPFHGRFPFRNIRKILRDTTVAGTPLAVVRIFNARDFVCSFFVSDVSIENHGGHGFVDRVGTDDLWKVGVGNVTKKILGVCDVIWEIGELVV